MCKQSETSAACFHTGWKEEEEEEEEEEEKEEDREEEEEGSIYLC